MIYNNNINDDLSKNVIVFYIKIMHLNNLIVSYFKKTKISKLT